jgi:hypothetical protein
MERRGSCPAAVGKSVITQVMEESSLLFTIALRRFLFLSCSSLGELQAYVQHKSAA